MNRHKQIAWSLLLVGISGLLTGCGSGKQRVARLRERRLQRAVRRLQSRLDLLTKESADSYSEYNDITVCVKKLEQSDVRDIFRGSCLPEDIQALHISIRNNSDEAVALDKALIHLSMIPYQEVADSIIEVKQLNIIARRFFRTLAVTGSYFLLGYGAFFCYFIEGGVAALGTGFCAGGVYGLHREAQQPAIHSRSSNKKFVADIIQYYAPGQAIEIPSAGFGQLLIFVYKANLPQQFHVSVNRVVSQEVETFMLQLPSSTD